MLGKTTVGVLFWVSGEIPGRLCKETVKAISKIIIEKNPKKSEAISREISEGIQLGPF